MRTLATMVVRNEASRYLPRCLEQLVDQVDQVFVYDDQSDDHTTTVASFYTPYVRVRVDGPSFLQHEGQFRERAWATFQEVMNPSVDDWVLAIDADEFLVSHESAKDALRLAAERADQAAQASVVLPIPEVWQIDGPDLYVRIDGFWGQIRGSRLFRYRPGGLFRDKKMGSGSEPTYVANSPYSEDACGLSLLHFGYARDEDKAVKYERYSTLINNGHADRHIASIVQPPTLEKWTGPIPQMFT